LWLLRGGEARIALHRRILMSLRGVIVSKYEEISPSLTPKNCLHSVVLHRTPCLASMVRRLGRKPKESGLNSASSMGSNPMRRASWTIRSRTAGIPTGRYRPCDFSMYTRRPGDGSNVSDLSSCASWWRFPSRCSSKSALVKPSQPAVMLPAWWARCSGASRSHSRSWSRWYRS
jgi:hypothetical protein